MLKRAAFTVVALILGGILAAETAEAGFRVCNRSSQRIDVAFGYLHNQFGWNSEGWRTIQPGKCAKTTASCSRTAISCTAASSIAASTSCRAGTSWWSTPQALPTTSTICATERRGRVAA